MADSLLDLASQPYFEWTPTWSSAPNSTILMARLLTEYVGTVQALDRIVDDAPVRFSAGFMIYDRATEVALLDFFAARLGSNQRFWVQYPPTCFTLKATALSGSTALTCIANAANNNYQGYERIYIRMKTGDTLTRKVTSVTYDSINDEIDLVIASPLDRDLTTTNHDRFGRLILARFESDVLEQKNVADGVCEIDLDFYELVKEYAEI